MWRVIRISPEGHRAHKDFTNRHDAITWLESERVKLDMRYGYDFYMEWKEL